MNPIQHNCPHESELSLWELCIPENVNPKETSIVKSLPKRIRTNMLTPMIFKFIAINFNNQTRYEDKKIMRKDLFHFQSQCQVLQCKRFTDLYS